MEIDTELLTEAVREWAPSYPRRASDAEVAQKKVRTETELLLSLTQASSSGNDGFCSVYSFPYGHPKNGNIPKVDSVYIDLDILGSEYQGENKGPWFEEVEILLERVREVANLLIAEDKARYWRASLSGHKGIHLFLDLPEVDPRNGSLEQFKKGLNEYTQGLVEEVEDAAGVEIEPFVDVDGSDLARLCRMPNTPHPGVGYTSETRWCVPVSIEELSQLTAQEYEELTKEPRPVPDSCRRYDNSRARAVVTEEIRNASSFSGGGSYGGDSYDPTRVERYREQSNKSVDQEDLDLILSDKPFVFEFVGREDRFAHGAESHYMEMAVLLEMIEKDIPIDVMIDFFRERCPNEDDFDPKYTEEFAEELIARDYDRLSLDKLREKCPTFYRRTIYG